MNQAEDRTSGLEDKEENLDERSKENEIILKQRKGTFKKCGALSKDQIF